MQAHLGSYKRIPACVPDEFMRADAYLPDDDVTRSPLLLKFMPIYDATIDDHDELIKRIVVSYD